MGWRSGKQHTIEIWFVEYDGKHYVISERYERAHWVQNIIHNTKVSFAVDDNISHSHSDLVTRTRITGGAPR